MLKADNNGKYPIPMPGHWKTANPASPKASFELGFEEPLELNGSLFLVKNSGSVRKAPKFL